MAANINDLLYYLEHRFLPETFFNEKYDLFRTMYENPQLLWHVFDDLCAQEGLENPYRQPDFSITLRRSGDKWQGALLKFPIPAAEALCYEEYLFADGDPMHKGCYTLEYDVLQTVKSEEVGGVLCAWTAQRQHINYGSRTLFADGDYFEEAFQLHLQSLPQSEE